MKHLNLFRYLLINASMLSLTACGGKEATVDQKPPAYSKPAYTVTDTDSKDVALRFTDITETAGIDFVHETGAFGKKWMPETMGSGGGFFDFDNDDLVDIFLVNSSQWPGHARSSDKASPQLYRNLGNNRFEDVTTQAGLDFSFYGMGCAFADYDSDGDCDVYLTAVGTNKLLRNDGGRFGEVTDEAGVSGNNPDMETPPAWSTSAAWVDVDRDGWLDLFVCNYVKWTPDTDLFTTLDGKTKSYATPEQYQGETCRLYRNLAGKRFEDITERAGIHNPEGKSLGVAVADFNDDGWPDLFVANDTQPNFLYLNEGRGRFTNIALRAGVGYDEVGRARAGMGVDVADITNEGRLSIAIGNFAREPLSLYTQINDELFQDLAGSARLTKSSILQLSFGLLFVDLNLDGFLDLVVGNGHIEPEINKVQQEITFAQKPQLFLNDTHGKFTDVGARVGEIFQEPIVARGIASADIDDDGDLDLLITVNGGRPRLLRNDLPSTSANWIKLKLVGRGSNRNAIGATVVVQAGDLTQKRTLRTGSSYLSQSNTAEVIFGLGPHTVADSVEVRWPTGQNVTRISNLAAGQSHVIEELVGTSHSSQTSGH